MDDGCNSRVSFRIDDLTVVSSQQQQNSNPLPQFHWQKLVSKGFQSWNAESIFSCADFFYRVRNVRNFEQLGQSEDFVLSVTLDGQSLGRPPRHLCGEMTQRRDGVVSEP